MEHSKFEPELASEELFQFVHDRLQVDVYISTGTIGPRYYEGSEHVLVTHYHSCFGKEQERLANKCKGDHQC
jgi:hypothetical protein